MEISTAKKTEHNCQVYDKKQSCYFCSKLCIKIGRHYQNVHSKEKEVAKALAYEKNSYERKKELERLRLLGNYHHNLQVLETQCGQLIVMRRPSDSERIKAELFLPCTHCYGFVRHNELWRHNKTCPYKDQNEEDEYDEQKYKNIQQKSKLLLLSYQKSSECKLLKEAMAMMKSDEVTIAARNDDLIMKFGVHLAEKLGGERLHEVSQGMQQLSRLLHDLREHSTNMTVTTQSLPP